MGLFDKRSDTERELEEYYKNREAQGAYDFENVNNNNIDNNNVPNISHNESINNTNNNSEKTKKKNTLALISLIGFCVLFLTLAILSVINQGLSLIVVGLIFFFGPMVIFFSGGIKSSKILVLFVSLIGACITAGGISMLMGDNATNAFESFMSSILPFVFVGGFLFGGLYLIFKTIISTKRKKQRCTYQITATVVDMLTKRGDKGKTLYSPVYKYSYLGKEYTVSESTYRSSVPLKTGDNANIFINENKPDDFYIEHTADTILFVIIGAVLVGISIYLAYSIFFLPTN